MLPAVLRNRRFLLVWIGQSVSDQGDWLRNMALMFWVYDVSGHSPVATAAIVAAEYLPALLFAPPPRPGSSSTAGPGG